MWLENGLMSVSRNLFVTILPPPGQSLKRKRKLRLQRSACFV